MQNVRKNAQEAKDKGTVWKWNRTEAKLESAMDQTESRQLSMRKDIETSR